MAGASSDRLITCVADVATHDNGGDEGTRTPDPRDANAVLFQLSYIPMGRAVARRAPDRWQSVARSPSATGRGRVRPGG
jgi:hypothetical protein